MKCGTIHVKGHSPSHYKTSVKIEQLKIIHGVCVCVCVCMFVYVHYIYICKEILLSYLKKRQK